MAWSRSRRGLAQAWHTSKGEMKGLEAGSAPGCVSERLLDLSIQRKLHEKAAEEKTPSGRDAVFGSPLEPMKNFNQEMHGLEVIHCGLSPAMVHARCAKPGLWVRNCLNTKWIEVRDVSK